MKVYTATLRFGQAASAVTINNPLRLSPLPSKADPEVVYLGVMKDGKRAAFLVPKTAVATGDGSCRPSPTHCEIVVLHPGETEFLDILTPTAGLVQYELDLVSISHHRSATQAEAASTHRRESQDGRAVLRNSNSTALLALSFSPSLGLVYERPKKSASSTSGTQTSATRELPAPATPPAHSPATPPAAPSTPAPSPAVTPAAANPPASGSTPHSGS
ncbi:MAG TPA: hypothetical protein VGY97_12700 [Solirubrobacteraceae bacterium]|jgi:hypothetical protein|nr:hypothetical protein [Solirubrobacteraceae bacterium]